MSGALPDGEGGAESRAWDRRATLALLGLFLALSNFPHAAALLSVREGFHYTGALLGPNDTFSYYAKMRVGHDGHWRYINRYSTEPGKPSLLFMFYIVLGHAARWTGLEIVACFHAARIAASVLLMLAVRRLIFHAGLTGWAAVSGFIFCFSITGLTWLPEGVRFGGQSMEAYMGEAYGLLTMMNFPHLALSSALLVVVVTEFVRLRRAQSRWSVLFVGIAAWLIGWVHPRLILTAGVVGLAMVAEAFLKDRPAMKRLGVAGLVALAGWGGSAMLIYGSYQDDAMLRQWAEVRTLSPHPWIVLLGYGGLIPLGVAGGILAFRHRLPGACPLMAWAVLGTLICYLPGFAAQRRMFQGLDVPFALLAGFFLDKGVRDWAKSRRGGGGSVAGVLIPLMVLVTSGTGWGMASVVSPVRKGYFPWMISDARMKALEWLRHNTSRDEIVLSSHESGQLIPAWSGNTVVLGHWAETFHYREKADAVAEFFNPDTGTDARMAWADRSRVSLIFYSASEARVAAGSAHGAYNPVQDPAHWSEVGRFPSSGNTEIVLLRRRPPE